MSDQNLDYAAIRRNLQKNVRRQRRLYRMIFFGTHVLLFIISMIAMWGTLLTDSNLRTFMLGGAAALVVIVPTVLWSFALLCHVALLYTESDMGEKSIREQLLMHEVGEEILRHGLIKTTSDEKPKRRQMSQEKARIILSNDGELLAEDEPKSPQSQANGKSA